MKECPVCQSCFPNTFNVCKYDGQPVKLTLPIETVIRERYRLEKRIGHGSVSTVYLARDLVLKTTHAVRIILPELVGSDPEIGERFLRDATATAAVSHPNIVAVSDSGMLNGVIPFILMEFVSGPSLQDILSVKGAVTPSEAFTYVSAIGAGLGAAHKLGVVHGDLKPRNILIEKDQALVETLKLTDFGLSRLKSGKLYGPTAVPKAIGMLRSPLYLAPEEWSDGESDNRSDIYSLGVILYQMLTGDVPFKGKSTPAIMKQHLMTPPPSIAGKASGISIKLEAVVLHALEKDPANRPPTVDHFVEELRSASKGAGARIRGRSVRSVRRPIAKVREAAEQEDRTAVAEVPGQLTEARDSRQLAEEITLVNYVALAEVDEPPHIDLDQAILNSKAVERDESIPVASKSEFVANELTHPKLPGRGPDNGELTLVNYNVLDEGHESPQMDLDQTIVNSKPVEYKGRPPAAGKIEYVANELIHPKLPGRGPDNGELTLVNYNGFDDGYEPPQIDLAQTIVNSKPVEYKGRPPAAGKSEFAVDGLIGVKPAGTEPDNFDMTIVPGMSGYPPLAVSKEPAESPNGLSPEIETGEHLSENGEPVSIPAWPQHSILGTSAYEADELPKSIAPIFLVLGVILVVLLIGVGVYYSHASQ